jgi:hypothetical protein
LGHPIETDLAPEMLQLVPFAMPAENKGDYYSWDATLHPGILKYHQPLVALAAAAPSNFKGEHHVGSV